MMEQIEDLKIELQEAYDRIEELEAELAELRGREYDRDCAYLSAEWERDQL